MMTADEKLAVQRVVVDFLQQDASENPTRLIDILLSGDGWQLVHSVLTHQEAQARSRAETLAHLLRGLLADRMPPRQAANPPYPIDPAGRAVPRSE